MEEKPQQQQQPNGLSVQEFFDLEDAAAGELSSEAILARLQTLTNSIRTNTKLLGASKEAGEREQLSLSIATAIGGLKRLNRLSHYRNRGVKEGVGAERSLLESEFLGLANLEAEISHLEREAQRCLEFRSGTESLQLVSEAEFYRLAPTEISEPELTRNDPHRRKLAQLAWELSQRKDLAQELRTKEAELKKLEKEATTLRNRLSSLRPLLDSLEKASAPLEDLLGLPLQQRAKLMEGAEELSPPLYTAFLHLNTYKEMGAPDITLEIVGDVEEARALAKKRKDEEEEEAEEDETTTRDEDDSRRKRHRRDSVAERLAAERNELTAPHPLSLRLQLPKDEAGTKLSIELFHLPRLGMVSAKAEVATTKAPAPQFWEASEVLGAVEEGGDWGTNCPNPTAAAKLAKANLSLESALDGKGRPYRWAQRLAGLRFPSEGEAEEIEAPDSPEAKEWLSQVERLITGMSGRLIARSTIQRTTETLSGSGGSLADLLKSLPAHLTGGSGNGARIAGFKSISAEEFASHTAVSRMVAMREGVRLPERAWHFLLYLDKSEIRLHALIALPHRYPQLPPLLALAIPSRGWADAAGLAHLESLVNASLPGLLSPSQRHLLFPAGVELLRRRVPVLVDLMADSSEAPATLYHRQAAGPERRLPLHYRPSSNSYHIAPDEDIA